MVDCPGCGGKGCSECGERGTFAVDRCPQLEVDAGTVEVVELAGMMRRGLPPIAGGVLDQAQQFVESARFVWSEEAHWRALSRQH